MKQNIHWTRIDGCLREHRDAAGMGSYLGIATELILGLYEQEVKWSTEYFFATFLNRSLISEPPNGAARIFS